MSEVKIPCLLWKNQWARGTLPTTLVPSFNIAHNGLIPNKLIEPIGDMEVQQMIVGILESKATCLSLIGQPTNSVGLLELYVWANGFQIFDTCTTKMRALQSTNFDPPHTTFQRWEE